MSSTSLLREVFTHLGIRALDDETVYPLPPTLPQSGELLAYENEALCRYLKEYVFPQLAPPPYGNIEIEMLSSNKPVYLFREETKNIAVAGKIFKYDSIPLEEAWQRAEQEYFNLRLLRRRFGMGSGACRVVAPLGKKRELSALLVTEKAEGKMLDYYIAKTVYQQQFQRLLDKLSYLASFFAKLHRNTERHRQVSLDLPRWYLGRLLDSLTNGAPGYYEIEAIERYAAGWWDKNGDLAADREVIVHGDATPTNFLFQHQDVIAIDLERMKWADRCWDLGFMAAELKHHFMWRMGDGWAAEPYIGHFLWQYAVNYGDTQLFYAVTRRLPLYMALGLLRIARNYWLDEWYRQNLLTEAVQCLRYGL